MAAIIGTDEEEPQQQEPIKWNLLNKVKSTVDVLLASRNTNVWSTYGGLSRILDDLEGIFRHGLKHCNNFFGDTQDYDIVFEDGGLCGRGMSGKKWLEQSLLEHSISNHIKNLVENSQLMKNYYHDYAFLRSEILCQALCTCLKAVESNDPGLLTQINTLLVNKESSKEEVNHPSSTVLLEEKNPKCNDDKTILEEHQTSYSTDEIEDKNSCEVDRYEDVTDDNNSDIELRTSSEEELENIDINTIEEDALSPKTTHSEFLDNHEMILAREKLNLKRLKLVAPKKTKRNIDQGTLAHVALSVVMESDERSGSPSDWFDGGNALTNNRRSSSLNEVDIARNDESEKYFKQEHRKTGLTGNENKNVGYMSSDYKSKKAIGHTRSKSDGTSLLKSTKRQLSLQETSRTRKPINSNPESQSRLSSSLPENSGNFYLHDPLSPTEEEQSLATMLASQDLTSCELEKENAHFSISEALIQAIEQMKCDRIVASEDEEDEDDEEIRHLKLEIERRRLEKKREKKQLVQPAFSDEKSTSNHSSDQSSRSSSSNPSILETDDISLDWEEISYMDDIGGLVGLSGSETTLVPESQDQVDHLTTPSIEASTSPPLSAEAVAKSLLKKFANKKHPAASELQWLVSEDDVPQSLLPLPQGFSVAPDDVREQDDAPAIQRRTSAPTCRMRGNLEWAPPRSQIIFHIHPPPKRKQLMEEQHYRCTGCGMQVDPGYMKRFRYCNYLGKYFCSSCHNNSLMVIPARIIRKWDFRKYEVSKFSMDLLSTIYRDPLFNIKDLNPSLYSKVHQLETIKNLRKQLYYLRSFAQTCRKSREIQQEFSRIPDYLLNEEHLYSLQDLIQIKSGELIVYFKNLVTQSMLHIAECPLCQAKGFICEYCRKGDDIIFPFELNKAYQCPHCRASFHKDCYVKEKCPKCERIRIRKSLLAAPIPPDDE